MTPKLLVENLSKRFVTVERGEPTTTEVLTNLSFAVREGEFVTIFGPNGCGKTTLLNTIAGVLRQDTGTIHVNGKGPSEARIGFIFQNYNESLLPWASVWRNIALPLKLRGVSRQDRRRRAEKLLDELNISLPLDRYPYQLSGGQKQLVAIARALMFQPDLLVMDEPFSALDHETRFQMQRQIQDLWLKQRLTILFVSHEIDEAIFLADRLLLLTQRPASIRRTFEISLPRPRRHKVLETEVFFGIRASVLHEFREMVHG